MKICSPCLKVTWMTDLWGLLGTRTGKRTPTTPQMAVKMATGRTEAPMILWKNTPISSSSLLSTSKLSGI